ncbi:MAG: glycosyltransferase family 2 protein [Candidatus Pacebacteria bacterium]|nr:glycosyltransferase family 2 protein [Candidatus Paceibacterota bacterium]
MNTITTPVVLIIFKREQYAREVFKAIRKAQPKQLFVIADGGRTPEEWELCNKTRDIIKEIDWPCDVRTNFAETNMRTKARIKSGLDWVFSQVDRAIILEDDCVPDQSFFGFCEAMLERYCDDERIAMITGDQPVRAWKSNTSYFFSRYFAIWGWATWRRAWKRYDADMSNWPMHRRKKDLLKELGHRGAAQNMTDLFDKEFFGKINSWATRWFSGCFWSGGLSIVPAVNLVSNIGVEGVHSSPGINNNVPLASLDMNNLIHPKEIVWDTAYDHSFFDQSFPWRPLPDPRRLILQGLVRIKHVLERIPLLRRLISVINHK